jgi:ABC-type antimicrobial peptide transport system permease subunit
VAERTQEIGIRLALGAERSGVVRMIVAQGMRSVMVGLAAGVLAAWSATQLIERMLYGVQPHDVPTFVAVTAALAAVAFIACAVPALRAAWIQPATALRAE